MPPQFLDDDRALRSLVFVNPESTPHMQVLAVDDDGG